MIDLTEHQLQQLQVSGWPPRIQNPRTRETFVLLDAEMYERVRILLEQEDEIAAIEETYPLVGEVLDAADSSSRESP